MKRALLILALVALAPATALACSQCMCGTPFPSDVLGGAVPQQIHFGLEDRYLSKSNGLDEGPGTEREREHRVAGYVLWRAADRVALLGRLPWNTKEITSTPAGDASMTQRSHGLGDAELVAMFGLMSSPGLRAATVSAVLGATAPTGSNDLHDAMGDRLDAHLQPGSGAWTGSAGLVLAVRLPRGALDASVLGRANSTNAHGYRYGDAVLYNVGFTTPSRGGWAVLMQMNGRSAERDRFSADQLGVNTGGTVLYAAPGLRWRSSMGIGLESAVQIPIAQSLFGEQREHTTARVGLSIAR